MAWDDNLEAGSAAHGIASSAQGRIRVLAGPGSGKSFAMKRRVARLLEVVAVNPPEILAVTFTRVAAEDLHRELVSLEVPGAGALSGRTLHSLAMAILMRNHVLDVLGRHPRPLNEFELEPLLSDLSAAHGDRHVRRRLIRSYGASWARLQTEEPGFARAAADQAFVDDLVQWLVLHEAMLMDEVIPHLFQYLRQNPGAPELTEFTHVLIDEYQDLNRAEQACLELLSGHGSICIVGDDDQSIYSFRHAHPEGIRQWADLAPTEQHAMAECRRCPTTVVRMANTLITRNPGRLGDQMDEIPANGAGQVIVRQYSTPALEVAAITDKIAALVNAGVAPREIIVLARRTFATPIFQALRARAIPTKSYYAETALDTLEAQERFALLKLHLNNEDRVALRWLLGRGHDSWRTAPYRRVLQRMALDGTSPWETMTALADGDLHIPFTGTLIARFDEIRAQLATLVGAATIDDFVQQWLPVSPETELLAATVAECREGVETVQELFSNLYDAISQPEVPLEVADVRIMSMHKSKGLSSPYVFIAGCVEGILPSRPDPNATADERRAKLEEDRRLFYVAITRVKAGLPDRPGYLAITYPQRMPVAEALRNQIPVPRVVHGNAQLQPSRFIAEMRPHVPHAEFNTPL